MSLPRVVVILAVLLAAWAWFGVPVGVDIDLLSYRDVSPEHYDRAMGAARSFETERFGRGDLTRPRQVPSSSVGPLPSEFANQRAQVVQARGTVVVGSPRQNGRPQFSRIFSRVSIWGAHLFDAKKG